MIPIVDTILRSGPARGSQAIVVYPMNALANSQREELEKFLSAGFPDRKGPRISTSLPSARRQWVVSACHSSLARAASKRTNDERGRLCPLRVDQPVAPRDAPHRGRRGDHLEATTETVGDRRRAGVVALGRVGPA